MQNELTADPGYNGLTRVEHTLPSQWYLDESHYQRELKSIWYRQWLYAGRSDTLSENGSYQLLDIGSQQLILLRDQQGQFRAFHNTCRHRGSLLLTEPQGKLGQSIVCPYHGWSYSLQGELKRAPSNFQQQDFNPEALGLYAVSAREWRGFLFVSLNPDEEPLESAMDMNGEALRNWPLEDLVVGHAANKEINCNWKVFWENFNECLHCPGVHPELSDLVPLYRRRMMELKDDPNWQQNSTSEDPKLQAGLKAGHQTWSADGQACDSPFPNLSLEERERGHTFEVLLPTLFMVGHIDYVRVVRLKPLAVDRTELSAQWLFRPETLKRDGFDAEEFASYAQMVMLQDARVAELNQRGLQSIAHERGVLMAEEYDVFNFQQWVRRQIQA